MANWHSGERAEGEIREGHESEGTFARIAEIPVFYKKKRRFRKPPVLHPPRNGGEHAGGFSS